MPRPVTGPHEQFVDDWRKARLQRLCRTRQPSYEYPGGRFGLCWPPGDGVPGQLVAMENLRATRLPTVSVTETVVVWTTSCPACLLN